MAILYEQQSLARAYWNDLRQRLWESHDRGAESRNGVPARGREGPPGNSPSRRGVGVPRGLRRRVALLACRRASDFNPIEQAWSKTKQHLRSAKARTLEVLEEAVAQALASLTPHNAAPWFRRCLYPIQQL
ncbi:MAG: hypothetical protein HYX73_05980 [Acidobacteria bacterium]|nr:hypothetical protein [Acidobacteriota bacterium]